MDADRASCRTCGQPIKPAYGARNSASDRIGIAISVLLHLLALLYYLTRDQPVKLAPPSKQGGEIMYIAPLADQPKPKGVPKPVQAPKPKPPPARIRQAVATPPARPKREVKQEVKREVFVPPVVAPMPALAPVAEQDMEARVAARRKQRAEAQPQQPQAEESEQARGLRAARANIAGAQGSTADNDRNGSGGVFSVLNQTFHSAEVKFRGWNGNFKRNWTQQVQVEQGAERDLETAIVKKMIELIRKEKPGDFVWDSRRMGRHVNLSARVEDTAELQAFLLREFFPDYRQGAR